MKEQQVGPNLKQARSTAGLSLSQTAELTGVSKAMLGQIERGESSPTLATMWKLCRGLRLPLTALIGAPGALSVSASSTEATQHQIKEGPQFNTLFSFDLKTGCEVFLHKLSPRWEHLSQAHNIGVIEDVFVIDGVVDVLVGDEWVQVDSGRAFRFNADQPHGYRNPLDTPSQFHNTIYYPGRTELG